MSNEAKKIEGLQLVGGIMSRKEAALHITSGNRHVHSHVPPVVDPTVSLTTRAVKENRVPVYPWELADASLELLRNSADRSALIEKVITSCVRTQKRQMVEKVRTVTEELFTNALYHASHQTNGSDTHDRTAAVELSATDAVKVRFGWNLEGIYLAVEDNGGLLTFKDVVEAFSRCYSPTPVIENKPGGAGLGLFMVFEAVTHLKVEVVPGRRTLVSCWIAEPKLFSPKHFSFNFFGGAP